LALGISNAENIELIQEPNQINLLNPDFILWVASPKKLTEKKLVEFARLQIEKQINLPIGIISGKNINDARYLWENRNFRPSEQFIIFNGTNKSNQIKPKILRYRNNVFDTLSLNKSDFITGLKNSEYIQVSLHGAARSWFDEQSQFGLKYNELPVLEKCIIQSHACNNFRPWVENSIALECINKGAIVFSGFVYPPISGSKIGEYDGLNFRYTWNEFPIGIIVQLQNSASLRTYAGFPHYFMLGDPRVCFNGHPPYEIYHDSLVKNGRLIKLRNAKIGFLPVKITNGADYEFINISNKIKHSSNDLFFNKHIESINIGDDKYVLFENTSDVVNIELKEPVPLFWKVKDTALDFIDTIIVSHQYSGFSIIIGGLFLVLIIVGFIRGRTTKLIALRSVVISLLGIILIGIFYLIRWDSISVTSKEMDFNVFSFVIDWFLLFSGILFFLKSKSPFNKLWASTIPFLAAYLFTIISLILAFIKQVLLKGNGGIDIMKSGYPGNIMLIESILGTLIFFIILRFIDRIIKQNEKKVFTP
jgi:hypothetical protein